MEKDMRILAIESSCDETSAAVVLNGREVLSNIISSQIDIHTKFGGVVPEVASRKHIEVISLVVDRAIKESGMDLKDIDAVGVTYGPGLVGALLVGLQYAKGLAYALDIPLIGVNHIEGHISANFIQYKELNPPFICLVVSGGHTYIVYMKDHGDFEVLGQTRDDAAGEAYDKVARAIGLGYPGGPKIDRLARDGDEDAIKFPRANFHDRKSLDFSFSGLKSAVLNYLNQKEMKHESINRADVAASFQKAAVDFLVDNSMKACHMKMVDKMTVAGGVAANTYLRKILTESGDRNGIKVLFPEFVLCTDNAAMIGSAAYFEYMKGKISGMDLNAVPNLKIGER
ncbi:MAG: tRNA (adenosine(37)-N6)-threonylcarbamoyltransferase complex transferase subunit TsaD [Clostridium sp.]|jgi:N6-L-threonylcarbamoyladenine synthase|uniref:tRNA (adenosine(37)-N6)-threonylcarbamoyltransferase complex transferase subunit TsaD n=1 Tax=Clostridium sp. TaxID=1506 RepID=UPI0025C28B5A|nr:tRNA (adenosine(37)-N6)-threonylcarbamoyltransferase complex transferase subunit TsaD [Clostridium sp.]MCH3966012.1 tRNA (adenosine(37)-N6)-threonylcarbamoyltransferase complex transferase subunit TsaD [Clostridium sp.]MCI1715900.1 tRNA (adenosine(37)-N6)-threonylcarbamoyltransferase complex transferase subunit TsaD [Clostridium sp.]MCI1800428.1 tRNA (adenosine(37)-N6)-threonylcarbamoyltransferase complex transferase subunit TsaD [Clostridium sp.]MCI1814077.1 tRNA (adenosine(37)-N6)-threonyl